MAQRIGQTDFEEKVLQEKLPVLVDFYSDSCVPCKQLSPVLGDLEEEYEEKIRIYKVNVNYEEALTAEYQVMGAPTLILFQDGKVKGKRSGFVKKADLIEWMGRSFGIGKVRNKKRNKKRRKRFICLSQ